MMRERGEDIMAIGTDDDGSVMEPIFPRARFAEDLHIAAGQSLEKFIVLVRNVRRGENLPHGSGSSRGNQFALFQQKVKTEQLTDRRGVRVVADGIAEAFAALAVMFADPEAAAVVSIIKLII